VSEVFSLDVTGPELVNLDSAPSHLKNCGQRALAPNLDQIGEPCLRLPHPRHSDRRWRLHRDRTVTR